MPLAAGPVPQVKEEVKRITDPSTVISVAKENGKPN